MSVSSVTSEALQLKLRQLLPSQQGFGTDLSASDTIIPIVDLTASAEGSDVRSDLQEALAFGSVTAFSTRNATAIIINNPGFFRIFGVSSGYSGGTISINMSDGLTTKKIYNLVIDTNQYFVENIDFLVFCAAGESVNVVSSSASVEIAGCTRQIADTNGVLVNPSGFNPQ